MTTPPVSTQARARRGLFVYFAVLVPVTALIQGLLLATEKPIGSQTGLVLALMWTPGFAALVARLVFREGPRDVSFRFGGRRGLRMLGLALAYPLLVGVISYGAAWTTGLERFAAPAGGLIATLGWPPLAKLALSLTVNATLGTLLGAIAASGEELGWRGYMLTRLIDARVPFPVLTSGVVWGLWHVPLIVSGQYAAGRYPLLSAALFVPSVIAGAYVAARGRLESRSIWPAIAFHAGWNAIIQGSFDRYTVGGDASKGTTLWTGEGGILVVAVSVIVAWLMWRRRDLPRGDTEGDRAR